MTTLAERWQALWNKIESSPTVVPTRVKIQAGHTDNPDKIDVPIIPDENYFQVRINQMFLADGRQWFATYDPMVFVVSEFIYDKKEQTVPFVVGPALLENMGQKVPRGMIFSNTRVNGLHPYRGGRLSVAVVLCQMQHDNYARKLMSLVESTAGALDFSPAIGSFVKIADVVLNGIEALLGLDKTKPLIGQRREVDPDAGDKLQSSYFALINLPDGSVQPDKLWVRNDELYIGDTLEASQPFHTIEFQNEKGEYEVTDFVLYSIAQTSARTDLSILPFFPLWERVKQEASVPKEENWQNAKVNMTTLYQTINLSTDLTSTQGAQLSDKYREDMKVIHERAASISSLGGYGEEGEESEKSELDVVRNEALSILDLP